MTEIEREYLQITDDILIGYDGASSVESLKALIDETRKRIKSLLRGEIQSVDDIYAKED